MKVAIMQPYLFPYVGYFQLMNAVDEFVIYDNIEFSKKGWINRNRILVDGGDSYFTVPLKKASDYLDVKERYLAEIWPSERRKLLNRIMSAYRKAPYFDSVYPSIEACICFDEKNLFEFIRNSLEVIKKYLGVLTPFLISSSLSIDHQLKAEAKVIEICKARKAKTYLNPIGGVELYKKDKFQQEGIELQFIKTQGINYQQFDNEFVPALSIIDVMMFNCRERIREHLCTSYTVV